MAETQHTAQHQVDGLAVAVANPDELPVGEWQVWIGPSGADPVGSDDGTIIGYGATRNEAIAMAWARVQQLGADLFGRLHS